MHRIQQFAARAFRVLCGSVILAAGVTATAAVAPAVPGVAAPIVQAVAPDVASAADISVSYCAQSLNGQTGQAPDDDISAEANRLVRLGYDISGASLITWSWSNGQDLHELWRFNVRSGGYLEYWFTCYRDGYSPYGAYHDVKGWV